MPIAHYPPKSHFICPTRWPQIFNSSIATYHWKYFVSFQIVWWRSWQKPQSDINRTASTHPSYTKIWWFETKIPSRESGRDHYQQILTTRLILWEDIQLVLLFVTWWNSWYRILWLRINVTQRNFMQTKILLNKSVSTSALPRRQ